MEPEDRLAQIIESYPLFGHLAPELRAQLVAGTEVVSYEPGQVIVAQGRAPSRLYVILTGQVRVWTQAGARRVDLRSMGAGAYFGEISVLTGKETTATVEASGDETAWMLAVDRAVLLAVMQHDDRLQRTLEGTTLTRARDTITKVLR